MPLPSLAYSRYSQPDLLGVAVMRLLATTAIAACLYRRPNVPAYSLVFSTRMKQRSRMPSTVFSISCGCRTSSSTKRRRLSRRLTCWNEAERILGKSVKSSLFDMHFARIYDIIYLNVFMLLVGWQEGHLASKIVLHRCLSFAIGSVSLRNCLVKP